MAKKKTLKLGIGESLPKGDAPLPTNPKELGIDDNTPIEIDDTDGVKDLSPDKLNKDVVKEKKKYLKKKKREHSNMLMRDSMTSNKGCGCGCGGRQGGCRDRYNDGGSMGGIMKGNMPLVLGVGVVGLALGMILSK